MSFNENMTSTKKINRIAISPTSLQVKMDELKDKSKSKSPKLYQQIKDNINNDNVNQNNFYMIKGEKFREIKSYTPNNLYNTDYDKNIKNVKKV